LLSSSRLNIQIIAFIEGLSMSSSSRVFSKIRKGSKSSEFIEGLIASANNGAGRKISTLKDFAESDMKLVCRCNDCEEETPVDLEKARDYFGEEALLKDVKSTCAVCGSASVWILPV
jgi:hypothetical protein